MFAAIAHRYDRLNSLLSLRRAQAWRRFAASRCHLPAAGRALDVATGTAGLAQELARQYAGVTIVGVDFSPEMLARARARLDSAAGRHIHLVRGDALRLPFPHHTFDCATVGFALRNVASLAQAFAEMARVVKPEGRVVSLELTPPRSPLVRVLFRVYMFRLAPLIGGIISGDRGAYEYLARSILQFSTPEQVTAVMEQVGLQEVKTYSLSLGLATVHVGRKGGPDTGIEPAGGRGWPCQSEVV